MMLLRLGGGSLTAGKNKVNFVQWAAESIAPVRTTVSTSMRPFSEATTACTTKSPRPTP